MDEFAKLRSPKPRGRVRRWLSGCVAAVFNLLTLLLLILTFVNGAAMAAVFNDPNWLRLVPGADQLLRPTLPALVERLVTPAPTQPPGTSIAAISQTPGSAAFPTLPPEWTATAVRTPVSTATPTLPPPTRRVTPTATVTATTTITAALAGPTARVSATPLGASTGAPSGTPGGFSYILQPGYPTYLANYLNTAGCNWFGIAGQVFDLQNRPVINLTIHLEGNGLSIDVLTGTQPAVGPGGYEIRLSDRPIETTDTYRVQLRNNTGTPLSDVLTIKTYGDCSRNLIFVNFVQDH